MAAKEPYDYLDTTTADYTTNTLNSGAYALSAQTEIVEHGIYNQKIHKGYGGAEQIVTLNSKSIWYVTLLFPVKSESDIGKLIEFYMASGIGYGKARTFKWLHDDDGHTYVCRFDDDLKRLIRDSGPQGINSIRLKLVGKIVDA